LKLLLGPSKHGRNSQPGVQKEHENMENTWEIWHENEIPTGYLT